MRGTPLIYRFALVWLALVLLATVTANWLPLKDPLSQSLADMLARPDAQRWFGADSLGRDVFSRTIHGFRITLIVSLGSVALGLVFGGLLGICAGYFRGWVERVILMAVNVLLAAFPSIDAASRTVSAVIAAGLLPAAMEMMDALTIQAVEAAYHAGYPLDAAAVLLIELDGLREVVEESSRIVAGICREHDALDVRVATTQAERDLLWQGRKAAFGAMGRLAPNYYLQDTVVPRTKLPATLAYVDEISKDYGLPIANVFHAGDGNLHPLILFDRYQAGHIERVLRAGTDLIEWCIAAGGAISGEHGIGLEKKDYMTRMFTTDDLAAMAGLKLSFDPLQRFNPDKVFPTGFSCGEVAALKEQVARPGASVGGV